MWFSNSVLLSDLYSFLFIFSLLRAVEVCNAFCRRLASYCHACSVLPLQVRPPCFSCRFLLLHHPTHDYTHTYLVALPPHVCPFVVETCSSSHVNFEQPFSHSLQHSLQSRKKERSQGRNVSSLNNLQNNFWFRCIFTVIWFFFFFLQICTRIISLVVFLIVQYKFPSKLNCLTLHTWVTFSLKVQSVSKTNCWPETIKMVF